MVRYTIAIKRIQESIKNCKMNNMNPNTLHISYEQRAEILRHYRDIEIGDRGQYRIFGLDIICSTENIFSIGYCATALNNWLKEEKDERDK